MINVDHINSNWLNQKLNTFDISQEDLCNELGFNSGQVSNWCSGRPMSRTTKLMFYLYFERKHYRHVHDILKLGENK